MAVRVRHAPEGDGRIDQIPADLQNHLENRPKDIGIGHLEFGLDTLRAIARGELREDALQALPLGDYLPVLLAHAGWWMETADLAAILLLPQREDLQFIRAQLPVIRESLGCVLSLVPQAWAETYLHSGAASNISAASLLFCRYCNFRSDVCSLLFAALPTADLKAILNLA